uniref:Globin family profile domain-containing protein n=1 Tax=Amphora coffeiformis TaxID=265554 RepID=A0A7S3L3P3_9STRA|mmetsp:Transcript_2144/g.4679  ORF Transcript_2144/g.4679 Transcript_2144/m.4679 type:complete len:306 (-) Transcript_2144:140-1057(-)|eukprot:scaffold1501_cov158-Amphora_coffeaeformis.AAC.13
MMRLPEEQRRQLKAMAEAMMAKRRIKMSYKEDNGNKEGNAQRAKLKLVAEKMKSCGKTRTGESKTKSDRRKGSDSDEKESKSKRRGARPTRFSLGALDSLPFEGDRNPVDTDESSVSTYTTLDENVCLNNSYNGSLGGSSRSFLSSSQSGNNSSLSRMLGNSQSEDLDCSFFLIVSNIWETVKRVEDYSEDLAEHIICHMMTLEPDIDVRGELKLKSFRSPRFQVLARTLVEAVDVIVTMIGPDIDDDEVFEIGERLRVEGVQPKLFGRAIAFAVRDLLGEAEFPQDDFDAWRKAFVMVCKKMTL